MVTSTIIGTCHKEMNFAWVNSFKNIFPCLKSVNRLRCCSLGAETSNASAQFCGSPLILLLFAPATLFLKIRLDIRLEPRIDISLLKKEKSPLKVLVDYI